MVTPSPLFTFSTESVPSTLAWQWVNFFDIWWVTESGPHFNEHIRVDRRAKSGYSNKKLAVWNARGTFYTKAIVTNLCDNWAGKGGVPWAFHTTSFFIVVATFSPPINPIMFSQSGTWLGYQSDVKKVDPLSDKGAWNWLSWKGEKRGGGTTSVTHNIFS